MRTVEFIRTLLFLPSWFASGWWLHAHAQWGLWAAVGTGLGIAVGVCIVATIVHDRLAD